MAPVAAVMGAGLVDGLQGSRRMTGLVFSVLLVGLFTTSGSYHVLRWPAGVKEALGRLDAAMIVLFIAGTFTPIAFHSLDGAWRTWSLVVAWAIAAGGALIAVSPLSIPRKAVTASFMGVGWLAVVPLWRIATALPLAGTALILLGGLLYTVGAVVYVTQRPNPLPRWFGFHEIFHLLVVAASVCHYIAILRYVG